MLSLLTPIHRVQRFIFLYQPQQKPIFSPLYCLATKNFHRSPTRRLFQTTSSIKMPTYIVTCKSDANADQVAAAKKHAQDQGGKIGHEYSLIKGFSVTFPNDAVTTLESHEHVQAVELDQEVKTQ
ncbi:peptidase inhibitor I9 [Hypoxylon fuscum]|nr:peptidase inhibitor I9 [Hypoxylon fuscum]